ncbi:MAG: alpha-L-fucosidase [Oscillospiraceae bacterium]|jgi:alpha-L-fucosidase|nr:alpha-L-fucosidase [Oscillospiraceae bacterium]
MDFHRIADSAIANGPYTDDWESLSAYTPPAWLRGAKLGIFIHWGVYSVPAYAHEWYPRNMYIQGGHEFEHHVKTYGPHKDFGYKDFIPLFKAEKFDPDAWAEAFWDAGARYAVPVAEHHDGFQMYPSALSRWNAAEMGPKRDVLGELLAACDRRGLTRCASSHRAEHWWFLGNGRQFDSDVKEPARDDIYWPSMPEGPHHDIYSKPVPTEEYIQDWFARCVELVETARPRMVYFDWWVKHFSFKPMLRRFAAYYYNRAAEWGFEPAIAFKDDGMPFTCGVPEMERGGFTEAKPFLWQSCTSTARNSWCYTEQNDYKPPVEIIQNLIDVVSKNGVLLLNVGPKADGTLPDQDIKILREVGKWLKANGDAVYGSVPWKTAMEGPTNVKGGGFSEGELAYTQEDIRFTVNKGKIYATVMRCPEDGKVTVKSLAGVNKDGWHPFGGVIEKVRLLGFEGRPLDWKVDDKGLHASFTGVSSEYPIVLEVTTG